jgi:hypothetical protein
VNRPLKAHVRRLMEDAAFRAWNAGNAHLDDDGLPIVWLHGHEPDVSFNIFTDWGEASIGFHGGGIIAATKRIEQINGGLSADESMSGTLIPVLVRAEKPLRMNDHHTWSLRAMADELVDLGVIDEDEYDLVVDSCDCSHIFAAIERAGYDAVIYRNLTECTGVKGCEDSLFVWRAEQIKSPFSISFDRSDPRLQSQCLASSKDLTHWNDLGSAIDAIKAELNAARPETTRRSFA